VLELRQRVSADAVQRIIVETYRDAITVCDNPNPGTSVETKFSLQHASAVVLARGKPRLEDFDMEGMRDPVVAALRSKVDLCEDASFTSAYPAHFGARISVQCTNGRRITAEAADALGDPENPLSRSAICDKARMLLASAGYGDEAIAHLICAVLGLAAGGPVANLTRLLQ
jgi:2-methylcitrate dehydratase PrpD